MLAPRKRLTKHDGLGEITQLSKNQADRTFFPSVSAEHISFDSLGLPSRPSQYLGACSTPRKIWSGPWHTPNSSDVRWTYVWAWTPKRDRFVNHLLLALSTLPAAAYLLIERGLLRGNTAVMGARCDAKAILRAVETIDHGTDTIHSVWVFVLLGAEGIKAFRANPFFACAYLNSSLRLLQLTCTCKYWHKSDTDVDHSTPGTYLRHSTRT